MNTNTTARRLALDLLKRSRLKVQMAAVLTDKNGRIFAWGWNHGYVHAEEHALSRANPARLRGATITIAGRRAKSHNLVTARPCMRPAKRCFWRILDSGVEIIEYLTKEGDWRAANAFYNIHT